MALADIQTFIILMLENRSFDHMVGYLSLSPGQPGSGVDGQSNDADWLNRHANSDGTTMYPPHALKASDQQFDDPPHERATIATQINVPAFAGSLDGMGGFIKSYLTRNPPPTDPSAVMGYYTSSAVPTFDFFAKSYVLCDHWFAALPTGTQANRLMAMSGESSIVDNAPVFLAEQPLVYDWLSKHQVSWCAYQSGDFLPFFSLMPSWLGEIGTSLALSTLGGRGRFRRYSRFAQEWQGDGTMPSVIFIEPEYTDGPHADPNDDHPPTGIEKGQAFVATVYNDLISNPTRWANTMLIVTYDEHGGFFDHVQPLPIACIAGGVRFDTSGVRVPAFVVSPRVAPGTVFTDNLDHTSILQLFADRFNANGDYSPAVGTRQTQLGRLSDVLSGPVPSVAPPPAPAVGPQPSGGGVPARGTVPEESGSLGATANSQALHNAAIKLATEHPELVNGPGWSTLAQYLRTVEIGTSGVGPGP